MKLFPLTTPERAELGLTHVVEVTADDLTQTVVTTAQTLTTAHIFAIGDYVERITTVLEVPFENTADAAFLLSPMSVGDSVGGVATILAAIEVNKNGSFVSNKTFIPTGTPSTGFTAATTLTITFGTPTAGKKYSDINKGIIYVAIRAFKPAMIASSVSYGPYITK